MLAHLHYKSNKMSEEMWSQYNNKKGIYMMKLTMKIQGEEDKGKKALVDP